MKKSSVSLDDISKNEISIVEANDKLSKLEKEKNRDKKIIAEYKEREKATARALVLYERKIKYLKEMAVDGLLAVCSEIAKTKENFGNRASKISSDFVRNEMLEYKDTYAFFENKIYDVCNLLEKNAILSNEERDFIANRKREKAAQEDDIQARFDRLKQEFNQKIGSSVTRKRGRPKKNEQSIIADIGLRKKVEKQVTAKENSNDRLNEIFYDAPERKNVVSSIPTTSDSLFDFNEALNPNLSLKDIMEDILSEKKEDVLVYDENVRKIKDSQKQSDIELLESGFIKPRKSIKPRVVENKTINNMPKKPTYEKRFLSIGNIVKDSSKK